MLVKYLKSPSFESELRHCKEQIAHGPAAEAADEALEAAPDDADVPREVAEAVFQPLPRRSRLQQRRCIVFNAKKPTIARRGAVRRAN